MGECYREGVKLVMMVAGWRDKVAVNVFDQRPGASPPLSSYQGYYITPASIRTSHLTGLSASVTTGGRIMNYAFTGLSTSTDTQSLTRGAYTDNLHTWLSNNCMLSCTGFSGMTSSLMEHVSRTAKNEYEISIFYSYLTATPYPGYLKATHV
jgi:hypothetical protein